MTPSPALPREGQPGIPGQVQDHLVSPVPCLRPSVSEACVAPEGWVLMPPWRGYALLGTGMYCIEHSAAPPHPELGAELIIRPATEKDRAGNRQIGEERDTDGHPIQPEDMAIRIGFLSAAAIDALESQLRHLREANFPADSAPGESADPQSQGDTQ